MSDLYIIELYKIYFEEKRNLFEQFQNEGYRVYKYAFFKKPQKDFLNKIEHLALEVCCFLKILFKTFSFRQKKVLCFGGHLSFFLTNRILGFLYGRRFHLYVYNFYLHAMGERKIVKLILKFLLHSSRITLIVQSPKEVDYYKALSKKCEIMFVPYCEDVDMDVPAYNDESERFIFTGGYSNRDYPLIVACAAKYAELNFIVVISSLNAGDLPKDLPSNVKIYQDIERKRFYSMMKNAWAVVVPLKEDVGASGQMLCLGAMAFGKPIIYTDVSAINYYFTNSQCGIPYSIGDIDSLNIAVDKLINMSKTEITNMAEKAVSDYRKHFMRKDRDHAILNILTQ